MQIQSHGHIMEDPVEMSMELHEHEVIDTAVRQAGQPISPQISQEAPSYGDPISRQDTPSIGISIGGILPSLEESMVSRRRRSSAAR